MKERTNIHFMFRGKFLGPVDSGSFGFSELEGSGEQRWRRRGRTRGEGAKQHQAIVGEGADEAAVLDEDRSEEALRLF